MLIYLYRIIIAIAKQLSPWQKTFTQIKLAGKTVNTIPGSRNL
jgi:hypothetical protein